MIYRSQLDTFLRGVRAAYWNADGTRKRETLNTMTEADLLVAFLRQHDVTVVEDADLDKVTPVG